MSFKDTLRAVNSSIWQKTSVTRGKLAGSLAEGIGAPMRAALDAGASK